MKKNCIFLLLLVVNNCFCQPDPNSIQVVNGISIWRDVVNKTNFYYTPGSLSLAVDNDGRPRLTLMLLRYTGNTINKDEGQHRVRSILQFRVKLNSPSKEMLSGIKQALNAATLSPLPIFKTKFVIALPSLNNTDTLKSVNGFLEKNDKELGDAYWDERDFTLRLDDFTAQYVKAQLTASRLLMYCSYTFYMQTAIPPDTSGYSGTQTANINLRPIDIQAPLTANEQLRMIPVSTDAFGIDVDTNKWADAVSLIDINSKLPPAYPGIDIYCYDFANALSDTLYEKIIQIKARGIAGDDVNYALKFSKRDPDIYAASVRFKYAVRLDLPFYYKVSVINNDGDRFDSSWIYVEDWSRMIDITANNANHL